MDCTDNSAILLVIDDTKMLRNLMASFSHEGYQTFLAGTCQDAQNILESETIEYLLSDINLSCMPVFDLARMAKKLSPMIKIILATGETDRISPEEANSAGIDKLIARPFQTNNVIALFNSYRASYKGAEAR